MTANEIAAAALANQGEVFNPQQQTQVSWPDHPVVGLAYVDQLVRGEAMAADAAETVSSALGRAAEHIEAGTTDRGLSSELRRLSRSLPAAESGSADAARIDALRDVMRAVAGEVR